MVLSWQPCCCLYVGRRDRWPFSAQRLILINGDSHASDAVCRPTAARFRLLAGLALLWPVQPREALSGLRGCADVLFLHAYTKRLWTRGSQRISRPRAACLSGLLQAAVAHLYARARRCATTMFARVAARVSRACAMNDSLVASGAVDTKLMWQIARLALALQCSIPPLDAPSFQNFDYAEFVEGAAHAYAVLNEVVYRKQTDDDAELLSKTCTLK